jgi:hypothetical protein
MKSAFLSWAAAVALHAAIRKNTAIILINGKWASNSGSVAWSRDDKPTFPR